MLQKTLNRVRRHIRVRSKVSGTANRPRLAIFRSNSNIYAQLIDDTAGKTLAATSDLKMKKDGTKTDMSKKVGAEIAKLASTLKITDVVFDRGGFSYHGRVKALADAAREAGLKF
ncbi:MAG: 50S ribosomal protein L18 [Candidatus Gracilibacteria bacterium]|nr:50S ribosomal protein L18 [Candidatus Gracilibacteria bacterium]